jgi:hypothetical protein
MDRKSLTLALAAVASTAALATAANAGSLSAQYFEVPDTVGGDFGACCSSPPATLPVITLGSSLSDGLPVTTLAAGSGGVIDQSGTGQILWWTPGSLPGLVATAPGTFTLGQLNTMFAPSSTPGGNDGADFETAILSGTLEGSGNPTSITVTSDDDAFVYVDGVYKGGNPGVHGNETTTIDLGTLNGAHSLEVFYADRAQVGANLEVSVSGAAVPEPAVWSMMLIGFGGLGAAMRSRRKSSAKLA